MLQQVLYTFKIADSWSFKQYNSEFSVKKSVIKEDLWQCLAQQKLSILHFREWVRNCILMEGSTHIRNFSVVHIPCDCI